MATCIGCDEELIIAGRLRLGMRVICAHCGAQLEVVSLDPLEVDWADEGDDDDEAWDTEDGFDDGEFDLDDDLDDDLNDDLDDGLDESSYDDDFDEDEFDDAVLDEAESDGW
jgi:lysine biosynthesis protein LysW